jgi:hypothetical protein
MKIEDVVLYFKQYTGTKVTFNSRKGAGKIIQGIAVQVVPHHGLIILRDKEDYPHTVSILTLEEI